MLNADRCFRAGLLLVVALLLPNALRGQSYQTSFAEVKHSRDKAPATFHGGVDVEASTGAVNLHFPLGPGIGARGAVFNPVLTGRFAPAARVVPKGPISTVINGATYLYMGLDYNYTSPDGFTLNPGELRIPLNAMGVQPYRTWSYTLPDGSAGSLCSTEQTLPSSADPLQIASIFGYSSANWNLFTVPPQGPFLGAGGELGVPVSNASHPLVYRPGVLDISGTALRGDLNNAQPDPKPIPPIVLIVKGESAYEFTLVEVVFARRKRGADDNKTEYPAEYYQEDGRLAIWDMSTAYYRLTGVLNRYQERVSVTYGNNGAFTATWDTDPSLNITCSILGYTTSLSYNGIGSGPGNSDYSYTFHEGPLLPFRSVADMVLKDADSVGVSNQDGVLTMGSLSQTRPLWLCQPGSGDNRRTDRFRL